MQVTAYPFIVMIDTTIAAGDVGELKQQLCLRMLRSVPSIAILPNHCTEGVLSCGTLQIHPETIMETLRYFEIPLVRVVSYGMKWKICRWVQPLFTSLVKMDHLLHAGEMPPQLVRTGNTFDISLSGSSDCLFGFNIPRHGQVHYYINACIHPYAMILVMCGILHFYCMASTISW